MAAKKSCFMPLPGRRFSRVRRSWPMPCGLLLTEATMTEIPEPKPEPAAPAPELIAKIKPERVGVSRSCSNQERCHGS